MCRPNTRRGFDHGVGLGESFVRLAGDVNPLEGEIVAELGMDHGSFGVECGFSVSDRLHCLVLDLDQLAGILGFGARLRHHGANRFALPAGAIHCDRVLRRRLDSLEMRQHADPGRNDLGELRAGYDGDHARRLFRLCGRDTLDPRVGMRRADKGDVPHARQHQVAHELAASLGEPREVRPRHGAADIGVGPVKRREPRREVVDNFHFSLPARARAVASMASTIA